MAMICRCTNPKDSAYKNYGGRGVKVCKRWLKFENFIEDMGDRPGSKHLDRINNDGDYKKSNCRWVTRKENNNNARSNIMVTYKGRTQTLAQWCDELGLKHEPIRVRLMNYEWSVKKSFTTPLKKHTPKPKIM